MRRKTTRETKESNSAAKTEQSQPRTDSAESSEEFSAAAVAERVFSARKTADTHRREILRLMTYSSQERALISMAYESKYDRSLLEDLRSELGGNLLDLCTALFTPRWEYVAGWIDRAIQHRGHPRETVLVELICSNNEDDLGQISTVFFHMYGMSLADALRSGLDGDLRKLFLALVENRRQGGKVNVEKARKMALELRREQHGSDRLLDAGRLLQLMATPASFSQLRQVILEYDRLAAVSLEDDIKMLGPDEFPTAMMATVKSIKNHQAFLADQLHFAINDLSLFDETLIRITVTRAEVDLPAVKLAYRQKYGTSLEDVVKRDTIGDYSSVLLKTLAIGDPASGSEDAGANGKQFANLDIYRRDPWKL